ncbi:MULTISPECIES: DUF4245 domain-containing protein [Mycobacteriaceae]|uniref:DUF4245 domain-containing protein n=1 Tax=Mycobacteriaceae TaxID=1762 RepID=UPI0007FCA757|nr:MULTISPECIES: DUF4245 domain-containing protein [Mycobacteriaceae]MCK0172974.1 DUF4245 domain-containing protein [Mycolicibacterium sp. F2034L]OBB57903.1 hypothetical protein A5757_18945 [Mycobacterium sp. 852013-51886_SCH5428379]
MSTPPEPAPREPEVTGPAYPEAKPRVLQDGRDMFWSMAPLVVVCILFAGLLGMCSFQGTRTDAGPAPSFDAPAALQDDADALPVVIRVPALPEGWASNSGGRQGIEAGRTDPATGAQTRAAVSRVGYLTPSGQYLSLSQSNADEERLVGSISPGLAPSGTEDVDGVTWVVYRGGEGEEPVWTTRLPGAAQVAITGAGSADEYRTLAAAVQTQQPLEKR